MLLSIEHTAYAEDMTVWYSGFLHQNNRPLRDIGYVAPSPHTIIIGDRAIVLGK